MVKSVGASKGLIEQGLLSKLKTAADQKKNDKAREGAMFAYKALAETLGHASEAYLVPELAVILALYGDKVTLVKDAAEGEINS